jgi:hypothetical protein
MSEPFPERLSRFTADAGSLDRDSLLVAVGRASARPNRGWIALAAALAVSQTLTLALLWRSPSPPVAQAPPPAADSPVPPSPPEPPTADLPDSPGLWSAHQKLLESEPEDRPLSAHAVRLMDSGPPLRAFAPPPPSLLN